jgi:iron complex outermembrane recepter protein
MKVNKTPSFTRKSIAAAASLLVAMTAYQSVIAAEAEEAPQTLDKVIVTAQKREQAAIDVPASVTAISATRLSSGGLSKLEDYVSQVPGMSITSNGGSMQVTLRGISTGLSQSAPTTAVYIDEAPIGSVNAYTVGAGLVPDIDPADLSRIEVLKGPQGTLFGAGAMGGLLRYVTTNPDFERASGSLTLGTDSIANGGTGSLVRATANLPFGDHKMAIKFSAFNRHEPGYIDNVAGKKDFNTMNSEGGRLAFAWQITPEWRLNAMTLKQTLEDGGQNTVDVNGTTLTPVYGDWKAKDVVQANSRRNLELSNIALHGAVGGFNIVSSTTVQTVEAKAAGDGTLAYGTLLALLAGQPGLNVQLNQQTHTHRLVQELRAQSTALGGKLDYEVGVYYTHEDNSNRIPGFDTFNSTTGAAQPVVVPGTTIPFPDGLAKARIDTTYKETSIFANATYALTEKVDLQAGLRFGSDRQHYDQLYTGLLFTPAVALVQDSKHDTATYLLTARYKASDSDSVYGRVATGYRPGGPSAATPITGAPPVVGPDSLTSVEAGWKTVFSGGKASFEAAVFHTDWKDIQIQTSKAGSQFFVNGGTAVSQGAEATLAIYPIVGLSVRATASYTDAKLTQDTTKVLVGTSPLGKNGDRLPFIPKISLSLASDYRWATTGGWTASVGGSINHTGDRVSDYSGKPNVSLPSYTSANLNAGLDNATWRFSAYIKNANNSKGVIYLLDRGLQPFTPGAPFQAGMTQPRTIGADLTYRF